MQTKILIGLGLTLIIAIFIPIYWVTEPGRQEAALQRLVHEAAGRGAELYTSQCAVCHGPAGEGGIGPALKGITREAVELEKIIARGIAGTAMPAMSREDGGPLQSHQIKDLSVFILNWDQSRIEPSSIPVASPPVPAPEPAPAPKPAAEPEPVTEPVPPPAPVPLPAPAPSPIPPPVVVAAAADELYTGKCAGCHGDKRQGVSGFAPELTPDSLERLSHTEIQDILLNGRPGTAMPPFKGMLSQEEIDALVQYIKDTSP